MGTSVVEPIEAESLVVSDHHTNTSPFHVFLASHESRLTASKPGRSWEAALGARNDVSETGGVKNHHCAHAACSAKAWAYQVFRNHRKLQNSVVHDGEKRLSMAQISS